MNMKVFGSTIAGLTIFGVSYSLVSFSLIEVSPPDAVRLMNSAPMRTRESDAYDAPYLGILKEMVEEAGLPPCAHTEHFKVNAKKNAVAKFAELWKGSHNLMDAAQRTYHLAQHFADLRDDSGLVLLRYEDAGDHIRLEFAHRRPVDRKVEHANRVCSPATHREQRVPDLIVGLTCGDARGRLRERIQSTVAAKGEERYWLHFEYALDYSTLEIDYIETLCVKKEA